MKFEKAGIPAILFASTAFLPLARSIVQTSGLEDLRIVIIDHPLGGISEDDLAARIDAAYEQAVSLLEEAGEAAPDGSSSGPAPTAVTSGSTNGSTNGSAATRDADAPAVPDASDAPPAAAGGVDDGVNAALDELRQALANDGAGLAVARASDDEIAVELTFTDETCMDCVIPPPTLEAIITDALQRSGYEQPVSVLDPRAD